MRPFGITFEVNWGPGGWQGNGGLFVTRYVLAADEAQARETAEDRLRKELTEKFPQSPPPKIDVDEQWVAEMNQITAPASGFVLYPSD